MGTGHTDMARQFTDRPDNAPEECGYRRSEQQMKEGRSHEILHQKGVEIRHAAAAEVVEVPLRLEDRRLP